MDVHFIICSLAQLVPLPLVMAAVPNGSHNNVRKFAGEVTSVDHLKGHLGASSIHTFVEN